MNLLFIFFFMVSFFVSNRAFFHFDPFFTSIIATQLQHYDYNAVTPPIETPPLPAESSGLIIIIVVFISLFVMFLYRKQC